MTRPIKCFWCGKPVDLPQAGWAGHPHPVYCAKHHGVASRDPNTVNVTALTDAGMALDIVMDRVATWPWQALRELAGPIGPGTVTYVAGFPGNGKTSFLAHCVMHWLRSGLRVFHMPLEATPREWLTRLICLELGINADIVLSLRLLEMARDGVPWAVKTREQLKARFDEVLAEPGEYQGLVIEPAASITAAQFRESCMVAAQMDCDVVVVDHVDHIGGKDSRSELAISREVQHTALEWAKKSQRAVVMASQLNSSRANNDPLAHFRSPPADWLWMKGVKEQVATVILGLFRPVRPDVEDAELREVTRGLRPASDIAAPNRMGVGAMKLRYGGGAKGHVAHLHYKHGMLRDVDLAAPAVVRDSDHQRMPY